MVQLITAARATPLSLTATARFVSAAPPIIIMETAGIEEAAVAI